MEGVGIQAGRDEKGPCVSLGPSTLPDFGKRSHWCFVEVVVANSTFYKVARGGGSSSSSSNG